MEQTPQPVQETATQEKPKGKTSFGKKFLNFLMYGGFIILLILAVVIIILVEKFTA